VRMCVCVRVCVVCVCVHLYVYVYMYVCVYMYMFMYMYVYIYMYMYIYTYIYIYMYMYIHISIYTRMYMNIHTYILYTHTHTHTNTPKDTSQSIYCCFGGKFAFIRPLSTCKIIRIWVYAHVYIHSCFHKMYGNMQMSGHQSTECKVPYSHIHIISKYTSEKIRIYVGERTQIYRMQSAIYAYASY